MKLRFTDKKVTSISKLLEFVEKDTKSIKGPIWFRGHNNHRWKLIPSIFRGKNVKKEISYLREFKQDGTLLVEPRPVEQYEWLFIMRHHNIPTRLLDWTESPLVSAYFATYNKKSKADAAIWVLLPLQLNKKNTNLYDDKSLPSFEENQDELINYNPKNFKESDTAPSHPIAFLAPRNSARMQAQLSVFTIHHSKPTAINHIDDGQHIWRYIIPKSAKQNIRNELKLLKVNRFQLYPELESIQYKITENKHD